MPGETVGDLCRAYLAELDERLALGHIQRRTRIAYSKAVRLGALVHLASIGAAELTPRDVMAMRNTINATRGPAIANQCVYVLRAVFGKAIVDGVAVMNPATLVRKLPQRNRRHALEPDQAQRVAAFCWSVFTGRPSPVLADVAAAFFLVLMTTGIRRSEGTHLRVSEYDAGASVLTITRHKTTSRGAAPKRLHLGSAASRILDEIVAREWDPVWMFPSRFAASGHMEDPHRVWKRVLRHLELPECTRVHDIRHGFAAAAYASCGDLKAVQTMLAHASIATTSRYVGAAPPSIVRPIADQTAALLVGDLAEVRHAS